MEDIYDDKGPMVKTFVSAGVCNFILGAVHAYTDHTGTHINDVVHNLQDIPNISRLAIPAVVTLKGMYAPTARAVEYSDNQLEEDRASIGTGCISGSIFASVLAGAYAGGYIVMKSLLN